MSTGAQCISIAPRSYTIELTSIVYEVWQACLDVRLDAKSGPLWRRQYCRVCWFLVSFLPPDSGSAHTSAYVLTTYWMSCHLFIEIIDASASTVACLLWTVWFNDGIVVLRASNEWYAHAFRRHDSGSVKRIYKGGLRIQAHPLPLLFYYLKSLFVFKYPL